MKFTDETSLNNEAKCAQKKQSNKLIFSRYGPVNYRGT